MSSLESTDPNVTGVTDWIIHRLGYPVVNVELTTRQLTYAFNEAVQELSHIVTEWSIRNNLSSALGLPSDTDFTRRFVASDFKLITALSNAYSTQARVGGDVPLYKDSFVLQGGVQDYYITSGRVVNEVMWQMRPAISRYLLDPAANPDWTVTEFGWAYMGNNLMYITPLYYNIMHAQQHELRQRIVKGDYSYKLVMGLDSNGYRSNRVTLYPTPADSDSGTRIWYFYWNQDELDRYSSIPEGAYVTDPATIQYSELSYTGMNSWAQQWIRKYALAVSKEVLARIRGKFASLQIPDADVTLDADQLSNDSKEEMRALREELKVELEKLDYSALIERDAQKAENINRALSFNPVGIFVG